jgi:peptidoglycan-N-acetylglucosamine deacetylase
VTPYPWPDGAPAAALVTFDVDGEAPHLWRSRADGGPRTAELEQRRFGPRRGLSRLLGLLDAHGLRATCYVPGYIARQYPDAVGEITAAGHELALHGDLHEPPGDLDPRRFRELTLRSIDALAGIAGEPPVGFRSPSWDMTPAAFDVLAELGVRYDSSLMGYDHPYRVGDLVEIPVDWATDDAPFYRYVGRGDTRPPTAPAQLAGAWADELAAACRFGSLLNLTMHPWLSGRAARAHALDTLLTAIRDSGAWTGTAAELAAWHASTCADGPRVAVAELGEAADG